MNYSHAHRGKNTAWWWCSDRFYFVCHRLGTIGYNIVITILCFSVCPCLCTYRNSYKYTHPYLFLCSGICMLVFCVCPCLGRNLHRHICAHCITAYKLYFWTFHQSTVRQGTENIYQNPHWSNQFAIGGKNVVLEQIITGLPQLQRNCPIQTMSLYIPTVRTLRCEVRDCVCLEWANINSTMTLMLKRHWNIQLGCSLISEISCPGQW